MQRDTDMHALTRDLLPATIDLLNELRHMVRQAVPDAAEKVSLGWRGLTYRDPDVGYFCGLFPRGDHVVVSFEWGVLLADPDGLLAANSCATRVRFVRLSHSSPVPSGGIRRLLREAVELPPDRAARDAMVRLGAPGP